jgi:V/A-type H+-transporting ATPase subunit E
METKDIADVQLKELIDAIQRDGVDKARQESDALLGQAREKSDAIVAAARAQAEALLAKARQEQERMEHAGRESLKQASRDLLLKVRKQLEALFSALLEEKAREALQGKEITAAISAMIANWTPERQDKLEILLPQDRFDALAGAVRKSLAARIAAGIEIKASPELANGFRVAEKDGQAYYDFSAASIAESLALSLNPLMAGIIADALQQDV